MNEFLEACGATGPLLLNIELPGTAAEARAFDLPMILVGRDARSDLRLNHPEISARHAYLQLVNGRLFAFDLGSRDGIHQGGKRVRVAAMGRGRALRIGPCRVRLLGGDNPSSQGVGEGDADDSLDFELGQSGHRVVLDLSHRSVRPATSELTSGLALIGSATDCAVRLIDPSVSNYHACLVNTANGLWVVDLLGVGGVRKNGHEVSYARCHEGDTIQLGHSTIRVAEIPSAMPHVADAPERMESERERPSSPEKGAEPSPSSVATDRSAIEAASARRAARIESRDPVKEEREASPDALVAQSSDDGFVFGTSAQPALGAPPAMSGAGHSAESGGPGEPALSMSQASEVAERVLAPMLNQVGLMQQQMLDEMHQARNSMYETFSSLHQRQSALLQGELDQLRRISQELLGLKADLEKQTRLLAEQARAGSGGGSGGNTRWLAPAIPAAPRPAPAPMKPLGPTETTTSTVSVAATMSNPFDDEPPTASASSMRLIPHNGEASRPSLAINGFPSGPSALAAKEAMKSKSPFPVVVTPSVLSRALDETEPREIAQGQRSRSSDDEVHTRLCDRIVQIRDENQSRWRKLLGILPGSASPKTEP